MRNATAHSPALLARILTWGCVVAIVGVTGYLTLRPRAGEAVHVPTVEGGVAAEPNAMEVVAVAPMDTPREAVVEATGVGTEVGADDPRSWCEPSTPPLCETSADCEPRPDGTPRSCVREWWVAGSSVKVCIAPVPTRAVQRWRADRLRVLVDSICERRDGCDPDALHSYLSVLARRESSWRPYTTHRLAGDRDASHKAWLRNADRYVDSPAHGEPWRWASYGYYGQNSAYALAEWDATDVPERLCGEVESTLVHLRVARARLRRLEAGVLCEGSEHHGTSPDETTGAPSWYDVSLANSGSDPCPGTTGHRLRLRQAFERATKSHGLDPYRRVTSRMLGRDVPRDEQVAFARRMRAAMDLVPAP